MRRSEEISGRFYIELSSQQRILLPMSVSPSINNHGPNCPTTAKKIFQIIINVHCHICKPSIVRNHIYRSFCPCSFLSHFATPVGPRIGYRIENSATYLFLSES